MYYLFFVAGKPLQREKRIVFTAAGIATAIGLATSGASVALAGAAEAANAGTRVVVQLEVIDLSKWSLTNPVTHIHGGVVETQARHVKPGMKEMMVMRKTYHTSTGSYGTVSWEVNGREVIVMWSAPYSFDHHSNWLAVGVGSKGTHQRNTFNDMYYRSGSWFKRDEYYYYTRDVTKCDGVICIRGNMGTSQHPKIRIVVYPVSDQNVAPGMSK